MKVTEFMEQHMGEVMEFDRINLLEDIDFMVLELHIKVILVVANSMVKLLVVSINFEELIKELKIDNLAMVNKDLMELEFSIAEVVKVIRKKAIADMAEMVSSK
jgi:hypothetical protein